MKLWANNEKAEKKLEKNLEGLKGYRNITRRYRTPLLCCECDNTFKPDKELNIKWCRDGSFDMICPTCNANWEKHWELSDVTEFSADVHSVTGSGTAKCVMADGRIFEYHYGHVQRANVDIPDKFFEDFAKFYEAHYEAKKAGMIRTVEVRDTFAESQIITTLHNGNVTTLDFKAGVQGIVLDEKQVAKVDSVLFASIIEKLREQLIYVKEIK